MLTALLTRGAKTKNEIKVAIAAGLRKQLEPRSGNFHFSISHHPFFFSQANSFKSPHPLQEKGKAFGSL